MDAATNELTDARVQIKDSKGKYHYPKGTTPYKRDVHFTTTGSFELKLPSGNAFILIEKGKEFGAIESVIDVVKGRTKNLMFQLERWIDMNSLGWYSGDLHVHRPLEHMKHLMRAEDLNVAPVLTIWNERVLWRKRPVPDEKVVQFDGVRAYGQFAQEDERNGGAVLLFNLKSMIQFEEITPYYPPNLAFCREARSQGALIEQEKPIWWEAPVNVALGLVDTIGIVNNHVQRREIMDNEAWGRPRDKEKYPGPLGFVLYNLDLYYHYLNLGIKIPISAGSASGVLRNPLGYNRLYVQLKGEFNYLDWLIAMKEGKSFATNGPMLFCRVDEKEPFTTFASDATSYKGIMDVSIKAQDPLDRVELVVNGKIHESMQVKGIKTAFETKFNLDLDSSYWVAARVFEKNEHTVRFAHSNPFFIELEKPYEPVLESALFYEGWCKDLLSNFRNKRLEHENDKRLTSMHEKLDEIEAIYLEALKFYENLKFPAMK